MAWCDPTGIDEEHEADEVLPYVIPISLEKDPYDEGLMTWKRTTLCKDHLKAWNAEFMSARPAKGHPDYKPRKRKVRE